MPGKRLFSTLAVAVLLGTTACADDAEQETVVEEAPAPQETQLAPSVTEGAVLMDTSAVGTVVDDAPTADHDTTSGGHE